MESKTDENYKKNIWMYLSGMFIMMTIYLLNFRMTIHIGLLLYWGLYFCQYVLYKRINRIALLLLIGVIILNFILEELYIYVRLDILLAVYCTILTIYYIAKDVSKYKWLKILSVGLIIPFILSIHFYGRADKLIKDRGLEKCIKEELAERYFIFDEALTLSNLEKIKGLNIWENDNVHNLEGIEQLKNLEDLGIDNFGVKNLENIGLLNHLKELEIYKGTLDDLKGIESLESLEELSLVYVKINSGNGLDNFHGLKRLSIQGAKLTDLSLIKELKNLEELSLSYSEIYNITGIEHLTNLKRLELYHTQIKNTDKIKESKYLEVIDINASEVDNIEVLKKLPNLKIISR